VIEFDAPLTARTKARDRRAAAVHEAGHVVVCRWAGLNATAKIWPLAEGNQIERSWGGQTFMGERFPRLSRIRRQMVAAAGPVAERFWRDRTLDLAELIERVDTNLEFMSESDWHHFESGPGHLDRAAIRALERVFGLLHPQSGALWQEVCATSRELIVIRR
jgi:hypothetical protein